MKKVRIYTDGGCKPNPGSGGWAAILIFGQHQKEISGHEYDTTNNRMELKAAVRALEQLKEPCEVTLVTDSRYVQGGFQWMHRWKTNGWKTADKSPVKNQDLWQTLLEMDQRHTITVEWTKGHAMNEFNNRCDELASIEIRRAAA